MNAYELRPILAGAAELCSVGGCRKPIRARGWCSTHYARWQRTGEVGGHPLTLKQRFWAKVALPDAAGCLLWVGSRDLAGYGRFGKPMAHRFSYELLVGSIPEGLTIDHLCRVRACVNPDHLEPVTFLLNTRRRHSSDPDARPTHCWNGHKFTPESTYNYRDGRQRCRTCRAEKRAADL